MTGVPPFLLGRRAAIAGLCAAIGVVTILIGIPILATYTAQQQEVKESLHQLAVFRAEAAMRPVFEAELQSLRRRGATTPGLITADSVALAQAQLQHDVKTIVEANGGEVRSAQNGPVGSTGGLDVVSIEYDLSLPISHLSALLYAVETHTPYLFVDHADIAAPVGWQPASAAQAEPQLEIHWTIRAYRWGVK